MCYCKRHNTWTSHLYRVTSWMAVCHFNYHLILAQSFSGKRGMCEWWTALYLLTKVSIIQWKGGQSFFRAIFLLTQEAGSGTGMMRNAIMWPSFLCSGQKIWVENWVSIPFLFNQIVVSKKTFCHILTVTLMSVFISSVVNFCVLCFHRKDVLLKTVRREYCSMTCQEPWGFRYGPWLHVFYHQR